MDGGALPDDEHIASLLRQAFAEGARLARAELDLVKAQVLLTLRRLLLVAVLGMVAALALLIGVIDLLGALPEAFGPRLLGSSWAGWLVLGGLMVLFAVLVALVAYRRARRAISQARTTLDAVKEDAEWLKGLSRHSASGR